MERLKHAWSLSPETEKKKRKEKRILKENGHRNRDSYDADDVRI